MIVRQTEAITTQMQTAANTFAAPRAANHAPRPTTTSARIAADARYTRCSAIVCMATGTADDGARRIAAATSGKNHLGRSTNPTRITTAATTVATTCGQTSTARVTSPYP